jgi:hypothetical protein
MSVMSTMPASENRPESANQPRKILFLDDDPARAEIFLADHPEAVWVETVGACIARLQEEWDEVHLDHDLGGEQFVDLSRDDCGMEVVRWLCLEPRPHLRRTQFLVHSHNPMAGGMMAMQIRVAGFQVEHRPFGAATTVPAHDDPFWNQRPGWQEWLSKTVNALASGLLGRKADRQQPPDETGATTQAENS